MDDATSKNVAELDSLPPQWPEDLLGAIQKEISQSGNKIVILDDDPTGTQTSRNLPVLTSWDVKLLKRELQGDSPSFFVLTNSRSMSSDEACMLARQIGKNLDQASRETDIGITLVSRSDSTLRGHFPDEVDAMALESGKGHLPYLLVPFFLEGGRYTVNDVHYVREGEELLPAAQTPFARDDAFGFVHSDLRHWVEEKTAGKIQAHDVISVSLEDIRKGGPEKVSKVLCSVPNYGACIVNCASYRDMEVVVLALLEADKKGREFLYRTAASFVRTRNGVEADNRYLGKSDIIGASSKGGLFLIGSYVEKTSNQVTDLLANTNILGVKVEVDLLLDPDTREKEIVKKLNLVNQAIAEGNDIAVFTSRELVTGRTKEESLRIGNVVSESLITIVRELSQQPKYLVAKGGITSSDVATKALGVKRATVLGQIQPGVPVWKLGAETQYPGMSYVIYPGNVGDMSGLSDIKRLLD